MGIDPAIQKRLEDLRAALGEVIGRDPEAIAHRADLGSINFAEHVDLLREVHTWAEELAALPLEELPEEQIAPCADRIEALRVALQNVAEFKLSGSNDMSQRDALANDLRNNFLKARQVLYPHMPYLMLKGVKLEETARRTTALLNKARKDIERIVVEVRQKNVDAEDILAKIREAASRTGVARFAPHFDNRSSEHSRSARRWLIAAVVMAAITIGLAIILLPPVTGAEGELHVLPVQQIVMRIVVLSISYYAAIWCARNFRANQHLSVVNAHRFDALSTFETFVEGTDNSETKDAVLLEATRSIFGPAATGYIGGEPDTPDRRVIEVFQGLTGRSSS